MRKKDCYAYQNSSYLCCIITQENCFITWNKLRNQFRIYQIILLTVPRRYFFCGSFVLFCGCYVFVRVCLYVLCGHLLGKGWPLGSRLWCLLWVCHFPIGILGQVWYLIVSIPDLCTLTYFVKKGKCLPLTKKGEYYINITFPDWVIVENIIPRNVIITFPEMIFSTITQSENVICNSLYRILHPLFSIVLGLPWWGEFQRENYAQPLNYMHEWKKSFTRMVLLSSLNARTGHDVRSNKLRHKKVDDAKPNTKQRHLNGILFKMWFCCKIENSAKSAQIWSHRFPLVLTKKTCTYN